MASLCRVGRELLYAAACLGLTFAAAFHGGLDKEFYHAPAGDRTSSPTMSADWSASHVLSVYGGTGDQKYRNADLASYLAAGEQLASGGAWEDPYLYLWPPGMPITIAAILSTTGEGHYPLKMILASVLAWAAVLYLAFRLLPWTANRPLRLIGFAAWLLLPALREWTFGFGSVMSESLGNAMFFGAMVLFARGLATGAAVPLLLSGLLMGLATAYRAYFEYVTLAMFGAAVLVLGAGWLRERVRARRASLARPEAGRGQRRLIVRCATAFLIASAILVPWRLYKLHRVNNGSLVTVTDKYRYVWAWAPESSIPSFHKSGNAPCLTDPELCAVIQKHIDELSGKHIRNLVLMTILTHPVRFAAIKLRLFNWLWFGREWSVVFGQRPLLAVEGIALLLMGGLGVVLISRRALRRRTPTDLAFVGATAGFIAINALVLGLYTYEWRYSQSMRVFCFLLPFLALAVDRLLATEPLQASEAGATRAQPGWPTGAAGSPAGPLDLTGATR